MVDKQDLSSAGLKFMDFAIRFLIWPNASTSSRTR